MNIEICAVPTDGDAFYDSKKSDLYKIVMEKFKYFKGTHEIDIFSLLMKTEHLITADMPHQLNCLRYRLNSYYISFTCWHNKHRIDTTELA